MFWQDFQISCVFPDREFLWPYPLFSLWSGDPVYTREGKKHLLCTLDLFGPIHKVINVNIPHTTAYNPVTKDNIVEHTLASE